MPKLSEYLLDPREMRIVMFQLPDKNTSLTNYPKNGPFKVAPPRGDIERTLFFKEKPHNGIDWKHDRGLFTVLVYLQHVMNLAVVGMLNIYSLPVPSSI